MADPKYVISMTSFPQRIPSIVPAIESVLCQKAPEDLFILWLEREKFPHGIDDVPDSVRKLTGDFGGELEIRFTETMRVFTKILPAFAAYPRSVIITVDDDVVYPIDTIRKLKDAHERDPDVVFSHCVCDLYRKNNAWRRTTGNLGFVCGFPYLRIVVGGGGRFIRLVF